jgi:glycosyltransferase involved in cell wall biosynthesis
MIKIVLSSIWYPLCMGTYFWRALKRRQDVQLTVVGPYTGTMIPWQGGMNLPAKYAIAPDIPLPYPTYSPYDPSIVEAALGFEPDIWLQIDAGLCATRRPKCKVSAHVATDPHCLSYDLPRSYSDKFFNMQTPYFKEGDYWLPYAADPIWHRPLDVDRKLNLDACLIGIQYQQRIQWVDALRRKGYNVRMETGLVGEECREAYSHVLVGLHWSSLLDLAARPFELMSMGLCPIINRVPDLTPLFQEEVHYLGFSSLDEAVAQVERAVKDDALRHKIGLMASQQVGAFHTWDRRVNQILEVCGYGK